MLRNEPYESGEQGSESASRIVSVIVYKIRNRLPPSTVIPSTAEYQNPMINSISMGQCVKNVTPLLTHWSYVFLAQTHRYCVNVSTSVVVRKETLHSGKRVFVINSQGL